MPSSPRRWPVSYRGRQFSLCRGSPSSWLSARWVRLSFWEASAWNRLNWSPADTLSASVICDLRCRTVSRADRTRRCDRNHRPTSPLPIASNYEAQSPRPVTGPDGRVLGSNRNSERACTSGHAVKVCVLREDCLGGCQGRPRLHASRHEELRWERNGLVLRGQGQG